MNIKIARKLPLLSLMVTVVALLFAQNAFAADASVNGYGGSGGKVQAQVAVTDPSQPSSPGTGSLPFTGMDLGLAAGGAIVLLAAGAAMAGVARRTQAE